MSPLSTLAAGGLLNILGTLWYTWFAWLWLCHMQTLGWSQLSTIKQDYTIFGAFLGQQFDNCLDIEMFRPPVRRLQALRYPPVLPCRAPSAFPADLEWRTQLDTATIADRNSMCCRKTIDRKIDASHYFILFQYILIICIFQLPVAIRYMKPQAYLRWFCTAAPFCSKNCDGIRTQQTCSATCTGTGYTYATGASAQAGPCLGRARCATLPAVQVYTCNAGGSLSGTLPQCQRALEIVILRGGGLENKHLRTRAMGQKSSRAFRLWHCSYFRMNMCSITRYQVSQAWLVWHDNHDTICFNQYLAACRSCGNQAMKPEESPARIFRWQAPTFTPAPTSYIRNGCSWVFCRFSLCFAILT